MSTSRREVSRPGSLVGQHDELPACAVAFHDAMRLDDVVDVEHLPDGDVKLSARHVIDDALERRFHEFLRAAR